MMDTALESLTMVGFDNIITFIVTLTSAATVAVAYLRLSGSNRARLWEIEKAKMDKATSDNEARISDLKDQICRLEGIVTSQGIEKDELRKELSEVKILLAVSSKHNEHLDEQLRNRV